MRTKIWGLLFIIIIFTTSSVSELAAELRILSNRKKAYEKLTSGVSKVKLTRKPVVTEEIRLVTFGFKAFSTSEVVESGVLQLKNPLLSDEDEEAKIEGAVLNYPNPFRQISGSEIGYRLSKNVDIDIVIYDMLSNEIFKGSYASGSPGGKKGLNRLGIDEYTFGDQELSAGIYFYYIRHEGEILGKGKFAVIP